jgi:antitoxin VapB
MEASVNEIKINKGVSAPVQRKGDVQFVEIPSGLEVAGSAVSIEQDGDRLIVTPLPEPKNFRELLAQMETVDIEFPDVDEGLLPVEDVDI